MTELRSVEAKLVNLPGTFAKKERNGRLRERSFAVVAEEERASTKDEAEKLGSEECNHVPSPTCQEDGPSRVRVPGNMRENG